MHYANPYTTYAPPCPPPRVPAGLWRRALSILIDVKVIFLTSFCLGVIALAFIAVFIPDLPTKSIVTLVGALLIAAYAYCYEPLMVALFGTTAGMALTGLEVVDCHGEKAGVKAHLGRSLLRGMLSGLVVVSIITHRKMLHDLLTGTSVVVKEACCRRCS